MTKTISFNELRRIKAALPEGSIHRIADELNVHGVTFTKDPDAFVTYTFKPQLKTVGPKFGPKLGAIRQVLPTIDGSAAKKELDATGRLTLHLPDGDIELLTEDLLIDTAPKAGYYTLTDNGFTALFTMPFTKTVKAGDQLGFDLRYNDAAPDGVRRLMNFCDASDTGWNDPNVFGLLELTK